MSMSTSLDDLGSAAPSEDEQRIKRIMAEMGAAEIAQPPPPVAQQPPQRVISEPPIQTSTGQIRMDPGTSRAHVIGSSTPTMADFHAMFPQPPASMAPFHGPAVIPGPVLPPPVKQTSWKQQLMGQLRAPVAVAAIVFFLCLPVVTSTLSRYASWMYLSSGEISMAGLFVKALLGAGLFVLYQQMNAQLG
jgi:hypothetical protein